VALTKPQHPGRVAIVVVALLIVVNLAFYFGRYQVNGPAATQRPVEIQQLIPNESDELLPQGTVGVDLRDEFTGQISVDGQVIPQDQTTDEPDLGVVTFQPGPGKIFSEWTRGAHTAVVEWWPKTIQTPEQARARGQLRSYTWELNVG
jgi:hypothetical protein